MSATPTSDAYAMKLQRWAGICALCGRGSPPSSPAVQQRCEHLLFAPSLSLSIASHIWYSDTSALCIATWSNSTGEIQYIDWESSEGIRLPGRNKSVFSDILFYFLSFSSTLDGILNARPSTRVLRPKSTDATSSSEEMFSLAWCVWLVPHNSLIITGMKQKTCCPCMLSCERLLLTVAANLGSLKVEFGSFYFSNVLSPHILMLVLFTLLKTLWRVLSVLSTRLTNVLHRPIKQIALHRKLKSAEKNVSVAHV